MTACIRDRLGAGRKNWADILDSSQETQQGSQHAPTLFNLSQVSYQQLSQEESAKALSSQLQTLDIVATSPTLQFPATPTIEEDPADVGAQHGPSEMMLVEPTPSPVPLPPLMEQHMAATAPSPAGGGEAGVWGCPWRMAISQPPPQQEAEAPLSSRLMGCFAGVEEAQPCAPGKAPGPVTPSRTARNKRGGTATNADPTPHHKRPRRKAPARDRSDAPTLPNRHGMPIHPMPEASEEEWERRRKKRRTAIDAIKAKPEYQLMDAARQKAGLEVAPDEFPLTPEVMDEGISKRHWEAAVMAWRDKIKAWTQA